MYQEISAFPENDVLFKFFLRRNFTHSFVRNRNKICILRRRQNFYWQTICTLKKNKTSGTRTFYKHDRVFSLVLLFMRNCISSSSFRSSFSNANRTATLVDFNFLATLVNVHFSTVVSCGLVLVTHEANLTVRRTGLTKVTSTPPKQFVPN